jgi:hypothetical protein
MPWRRAIGDEGDAEDRALCRIGLNEPGVSIVRVQIRACGEDDTLVGSIDLIDLVPNVRELIGDQCECPVRVLIEILNEDTLQSLLLTGSRAIIVVVNGINGAP